MFHGIGKISIVNHPSFSGQYQRFFSSSEAQPRDTPMKTKSNRECSDVLTSCTPVTVHPHLSILYDTRRSDTARGFNRRLHVWQRFRDFSVRVSSARPASAPILSISYSTTDSKSSRKLQWSNTTRKSSKRSTRLRQYPHKAKTSQPK